jgi:large subunit ribosomal protein L7/L12
MAVARTDILEAIANMTVLELSQLIKEMEDKFGVSAAAPLRAAVRPHRRPKSRPSSRSCSPPPATTR